MTSPDSFTTLEYPAENKAETLPKQVQDKTAALEAKTTEANNLAEKLKERESEAIELAGNLQGRKTKLRTCPNRCKR